MQYAMVLAMTSYAGCIVIYRGFKPLKMQWLLEGGAPPPPPLEFDKNRILPPHTFPLGRER